QAIKRDRVARRERADMGELYDRYNSLTPREREIMGWVVSGLLNKQIAAELGISEIMVKVHRGQVMQKMQADSLADLVRMSEKLPFPPAKKSKEMAPLSLLIQSYNIFFFQNFVR